MPERSMQEIARIVRSNDKELRTALKEGRSGLFFSRERDYFVQGQVPLGKRHDVEVIQIFADEADLDLFYKFYLGSDDAKE